MFSRIHSRHCLNRCSFVIGVLLGGAPIPNDGLLVTDTTPDTTKPIWVGNSPQLNSARSEIARANAIAGSKTLRMLMLIPDDLHLVASNASADWAWVFIMLLGVITPDVPAVITAERFVPFANAQFPLKLWKLFLRWLLRLWGVVNGGLLNLLLLERPHLTSSPSSSQRYSQAQPQARTRFRWDRNRNHYRR